MSTDPAGNSYLVGYNVTTAVVGPYTISTPNSGIVIKYDAAGNMLWLNTLTSSGGPVQAFGVSCDNSGNIFVTGHFFGTLTAGSYTAASNGSLMDVFVVKYNAAGNVLWLKSFGGNNGDLSNSASTDNAGNCYITGYYSSINITFGTYTLTNTVSGSFNYFLTKLDANGNTLWAVGGQAGQSQSNQVCTDPSGDVAIAGTFSGSIIAGTSTLNSQGGFDMFIAKYTSAGALAWFNNYGGTSDDIAYCVTSDPAGNFYFGGSFASPTVVTGNTSIVNTVSFSTFPSHDGCFMKLGASGSFQWSRSYGGNGKEILWALAANTNSLFVFGALGSNTASIGSTTLTIAANSDTGVLGFYDLSGNLSTAWAMAAGGDDWSSLTFDKNCNLYLGGDIIP